MKTPYRKLISAGLLALVLVIAAFVPKEDDPINKLVTALQQWADKHPQEKVYLHTDKPYYALGDTIWFKGYVTVGSRHQLSALSGAVYVDLVTEQDSVLRSLKLPVTSGMVMGDFTLDDEFKEGSYRLRAYTQWMRNAGEEHFFDRTITVGTIVNNGVIAKADYNYKVDGDKNVLTATLNYTDDAGKPIAGQSVAYQVMLNKKAIYTSSAKTDDKGDIFINIANSDKVDLRGAFIRTTIENADKQKIKKDLPIKANLTQSDVQFFPESGSLVAGITSRVGFKAVGIDGAGIPVKGIIHDNENKEVGSFETLRAGMGSFNLFPEAGKTYTATISFADGSSKTLALPKALDEGYILAVYQPNKDSVLVRINASAKQVQSQPIVGMIAQTNGETIVATNVRIEKPITSIWLAKKNFPSGIAQFTLFDNNNQPLAERVVFIKTNDRMQLSLSSAAQGYSSKQLARVLLKAKDSKGMATYGNFSVSVIDESKVPVSEDAESTIFSNLLLTSDLRGYVEKPNYYFSDAEGVDRALDNLMLTQGYRRFTWKDINDPAKPAFEVEGLGTTISGVVNTMGNKPMPGASVTLMSVKANVMLQTKSDSLGRFKFDKIFATDSISFAVQARTAKGSDKAIVVLDSVPKVKLAKNRNLADVSTNLNATLKAYLDAGKKQDELYEKLGMLHKVQRLREVRINAKGNVTPSVVDITPQGMFRINGSSADQQIKIDANIGTFQTLAQYLQVRLQGVRVVSGATAKLVDSRGGELNLIFNGRRLLTSDPSGRLEISEILDGGVQPEDVAKLELVRTNRALVDYLGGPALLIYTKNSYMRKSYTPNVVNIKPKGFNKAREFYQPKYSRPGSRDVPDLRSTIYWNPYVKTDVSGQALFSYYNADGHGSYKVIVEGINADGELGRAVFRYNVEAGQSTAKGPALDLSDPTAKSINASLDTMRKRLPVEKIYLHTDKPYYNIGDTLWFKSYLVDGASHLPSKLSKFLYVELANDSSEMVRRIQIPVNDGAGTGQIPLTKAIFKEGGYTLRAYTNWMQNFGQNYIFNQRFYLGIPAEEAWLVKSNANISPVEGSDQLDVNLKLSRSDRSPVAMHKVLLRIYEDKRYLYSEEVLTGIDGSASLSKKLRDKIDSRRLRVEIRSLEAQDGERLIQIPLNVSRADRIDVKFLPEGGQLVAGHTSTLAFKALSEAGKGISILGEICDSKGLKVADILSTHNGMGSIVFTPKPGESYTAKISKPVLKSFELPKINAVGTTMHVTNPEQGDDLLVQLSSTQTVMDSTCYLVGTTRGKLSFVQKVTFNGEPLKIAKDRFPSGITRLTLLKGNRPLNERMIYINANDGLDITVSPHKTAYLSRDSVALNVQVKDKAGLPVRGSFSLAVTDDSQVKPDSLGNYNIATSLLLNSELKGQIESPGYYLDRKNKDAWQHLDNLLLTQGWTAYDWKDAFATEPAKPLFAAEKEFKISGLVVNLANKPVANAEVLLSSQKPNFITTAKADDKGRFLFNKLPTIDSGSFFLQANNAKGKARAFGAIYVDKFKPAPIPDTRLDRVEPWFVNTDSVQLNYVKRIVERNLDKKVKMAGTVLKEVKIRSKKIIKNSFNRNGSGEADLVLDEQDIKESATQTLWELMRQKIPGIAITMERGLPTLKVNSYYVTVDVDGGGLPIDLGGTPTEDDLMAALNEVKVSTIKGLEYMHSKKYLWKYNVPPLIQRSQGRSVPYTLTEDSLRMGILSDHLAAEVEVGLYVYPIYVSPHRAGYLDDRINTLGTRRGGGTIEIAVIQLTTNNGKGWQANRTPSIATYRPLPVVRPQQFYSPKYINRDDTGVPDYRSTVFWEPHVNTDANGNAKVWFYSNDIKTNYTIKIAGIDESGSLGDNSSKIKVQ